MPPEWQAFWTIAQQFGIPTAVFLVIGLSNYREIWIWGPVHRQKIKDVTDKFTEAIASLHERITREETDHKEELRILKEDRDFWRGAYFKAVGIGEQLAKNERRGRVILTKPR